MFIAREQAEFEMGRQHLANMMGMDPHNMTQAHGTTLETIPPILSVLWTVFRIHPVFLLILILIFRIRSGFLADPDPDSGKKFDPDPEKKSGSETLVVEMAGSGENVYTNKEHSFEK